MKYVIKNEVDYMVARAQVQTDAVRELLKETQQENDYWKEKAAAKLVAFHENEEKLLSLYAEMKVYHPDLAIALEKRRPYLLDLVDRAREQWEEQRKNQVNSVK